MCNMQYTVDLINNSISRGVQEECANRLCKQVVQGIYIAAVWMMENNYCPTVY